jgi:hypothetical protein
MDAVNRQISHLSSRIGELVRTISVRASPPGLKPREGSNVNIIRGIGRFTGELANLQENLQIYRKIGRLSGELTGRAGLMEEFVMGTDLF